MQPTIKSKLQRVPAGTMLIFFLTILFVGYYRRGDLLAIWLAGWFSFFLYKLVISVKKRVEERQATARRAEISKN